MTAAPVRLLQTVSMVLYIDCSLTLWRVCYIHLGYLGSFKQCHHGYNETGLSHCQALDCLQDLVSAVHIRAFSVNCFQSAWGFVWGWRNSLGALHLFVSLCCHLFRFKSCLGLPEGIRKARKRMLIVRLLRLLSITADCTGSLMASRIMFHAVAGLTSMVVSKSSAYICPRCGWRSPWSTSQSAWQP